MEEKIPVMWQTSWPYAGHLSERISLKRFQAASLIPLPRLIVSAGRSYGAAAKGSHVPNRLWGKIRTIIGGLLAQGHGNVYLCSHWQLDKVELCNYQRTGGILHTVGDKDEKKIKVSRGGSSEFHFWFRKKKQRLSRVSVGHSRPGVGRFISTQADS